MAGRGAKVGKRVVCAYFGVRSPTRQRRCRSQLGFEPLTYGSGGGSATLAGGSSASQTAGNVRFDDRARVQAFHPLGAVRSPFAAPVLQLADAAMLLSVRDAAAQLGVCTATIYTLCERGELGHVRILNAIRIAATDLAAFVARNTTLSREGEITGCRARGRDERST
jgi:excisionase family DNA binding protein